MKKRLIILVIFVGILFIMSGCANVETIEACTEGKEYGFWNGLWHGFIAPISFIGSLLEDNIAVYAVNNNGGWYDLGFLLGVGAFSCGIR
jgi:uncharacterized membrane protein HdeD (DUF308 family)